MAVLLTVAFIATSTALLYVYRKFHKHQAFKRLGIPGPEPHWLFGNLLEIWSSKNRHLVFHQWSKTYGPFVGFYEGGTPVLLTSSIDAMNQFCVQQFSNFQGRHVLIVEPSDNNFLEKAILPSAIVCSQGDKWKRLRLSTNVAFSDGKLRTYLPSIKKSQQDLLAVLAKRAESGEAFNIHETFQLLTLDVIALNCFGIELKALFDENGGHKNPLLKSVRATLELLRETPKALYPLLIFSEIAYPMILLSKLLAVNFNLGPVGEIGKLQRIADAVIRERGSGPEQRRADILQSLIDSSELSRNEVLTQATDLFLAGTETTSASMAYACYLLAKHQDIQSKLYDEVEALFREEKQANCAEILAAPFLDCVCLETLRLFPAAITAVNRFILDDTLICGVQMPKGAVIYCDIFTIHNDPELWGPVPPETFYPERFSKQYLEDHPRPETAFLAFGFGPKTCVGMRLALLEMKLTLINLLNNFKVVERDGGYPGGIPLKTEFLMAPADGIFVKLQSRH